MERISINAEVRTETGKGGARSLRRAGQVPAVLYRGGKAESIKLSKKELARLINNIAGEQVMIDLNFGDGTKKLAIIKDFQVDPVRGDLLHTDFFEVSMTEPVRVTVHVVTKGEPIGVKRDGGIFQHALREIEIECLPDKIPGKIEVDVSNLAINQSIHVGDLKIGEGIKVLSDPGDVIALVSEITAEAAPSETTEAVAEPEVIKKGKKEEEGAAEKKGK